MGDAANSKVMGAGALASDVHAHIEEAAKSIAQLHAEHNQQASPHQLRIDRITAFLGQPWALGALTLGIVAWVCGNLLAGYFRYEAMDPPPFPGLGAVVSLASLSMMLLVLATQRRENQLAQKREQLTLELALLGEQKTAKIIELLEELRRDFPLVHDRVDEQAAAMAKPADPQRVIQAIAETHAEMEDILTAAPQEAAQADRR